MTRVSDLLQSSIEALHALYCRPHFEKDEFRDLICPMYTTESVGLLRKLYEWSIVDATRIDEAKYAVSKKLSEVWYSISSNQLYTN
jgi:exportin-5